ncbi:methyltransferase domain-containing protein [Winogradskyella aquimaris]|uniref:Methyltransferase domain-containing protein n=1 Tax=Winogradskyella aquimaris TaxID=864074 RepID=A0ABU5EL25_9FLAO|nr:methyltransferase domain-containing protein [Winogradskyella aquimaris]MDY2587022.1 methyltransferase domain-containing protein [Winogradskyella aquimaris]
MEDFDNYFKTNKETWNKKVAIHAESNMYELEAFKAGKSSLMQYELEALGNVNGKSLLHLQCHFGQDTLSWARMGAECFGVDLSDEGIKLAKQLNDKLQLDAKFVCCNVLDTSKHISKRFDIVYTSYGVIGWLPDLKPWAKMITERLKVGGTFYMVEFHPILWMFDYVDSKPKLKYHYSQDEVIYEEYQGTYANPSSKIVSKEYGWNHGLSEVVNALIEAGLEIDYLNEHDESPYDVFPDLVKTEAGMYKMKNQLFPMIFELKATKR